MSADAPSSINIELIQRLPRVWRIVCDVTIATASEAVTGGGRPMKQLDRTKRNIIAIGQLLFVAALVGCGDSSKGETPAGAHPTLPGPTPTEMIAQIKDAPTTTDTLVEKITLIKMRTDLLGRDGLTDTAAANTDGVNAVAMAEMGCTMLTIAQTQIRQIKSSFDTESNPSDDLTASTNSQLSLATDSAATSGTIALAEMIRVRLLFAARLGPAGDWSGAARAINGEVSMLTKLAPTATAPMLITAINDVISATKAGQTLLTGLVPHQPSVDG